MMKSFGGGSGRKPNKSSGRGNQPDRPSQDAQSQPQNPARPARPQQPVQPTNQQPPQPTNRQMPPAPGRQQPPMAGRQQPPAQQFPPQSQNPQAGRFPQPGQPLVQQNLQSGQFPQQSNQGGMPAWDQPNQNNNQYADSDQDDYADGEFHKPDPSKRIISLMIDFAAAYFAGVIVAMIPFVNRFISLQLVIIAFMLTRDYLFSGRGIGKNLMGMRVIDNASGGAPSILQSLKRNVVLLAPILVLAVVSPILRFIPFGWFNEGVMSLINIVGMIYVAIVLPLESWRAYSREDGLRIGDEFAGTSIVDGTMDFSNPFNR